MTLERWKRLFENETFMNFFFKFESQKISVFSEHTYVSGKNTLDSFPIISENFCTFAKFLWRVFITAFDKSNRTFPGTYFSLRKPFLCQFWILRHLFRPLVEKLPAILSKLDSKCAERHFEEHLFRREKQLFPTFLAIERKFFRPLCWNFFDAIAINAFYITRITNQGKELYQTQKIFTVFRNFRPIFWPFVKKTSAVFAKVNSTCPDNDFEKWKSGEPTKRRIPERAVGN